MGRMEYEGHAKDDLVFEGDDLTWGDVARAIRVEELRVYTRAKASKRPTLKLNSRPSSSKHTPTLALIDEDEEMIYLSEEEKEEEGQWKIDDEDDIDDDFLDLDLDENLSVYFVLEL